MLPNAQKIIEQGYLFLNAVINCLYAAITKPAPGGVLPNRFLSCLFAACFTSHESFCKRFTTTMPGINCSKFHSLFASFGFKRLYISGIISGYQLTISPM